MPSFWLRRRIMPIDAAPAVQDFRDPGSRADDAFEVLSGETLLLHAERDRFDRVGRIIG
jgi:hypothetical protein